MMAKSEEAGKRSPLSPESARVHVAGPAPYDARSLGTCRNFAYLIAAHPPGRVAINRDLAGERFGTDDSLQVQLYAHGNSRLHVTSRPAKRLRVFQVSAYFRYDVRAG